MALSKNKPKTIRVTETRPVILGKYQFPCGKCKKIHNESAYCIAQRAAGHEIIHTCSCGYQTFLEPYEIN